MIILTSSELESKAEMVPAQDFQSVLALVFRAELRTGTEYIKEKQVHV